MPRPPRIQFEGAVYHVFNRGNGKMDIFKTYKDYYVFCRILNDSLVKFGIELFAFCLMKNHYHLLLKISRENLDKTMHRLQANYARYFNQKYEKVGPLFQGRYKSPLVSDDKYFLTALRYIHLNPLEVGMDIQKYPWSSFRNHTDNRESNKISLNTKYLLGLFDEHCPKTAARAFLLYHDQKPPADEKEEIEWKLGISA